MHQDHSQWKLGWVYDPTSCSFECAQEGKKKGNHQRRCIYNCRLHPKVNQDFRGQWSVLPPSLCGRRRHAKLYSGMSAGRHNYQRAERKRYHRISWCQLRVGSIGGSGPFIPAIGRDEMSLFALLNPSFNDFGDSWLSDSLHQPQPGDQEHPSKRNGESSTGLMSSCMILTECRHTFEETVIRE